MQVSELQHTNLVRLLGFWVEGEEKALVYEHMPNKSLDFFLFDSTRKTTLNWRKRFIIIEGIAQGLVYLHEYSRFGYMPPEYAMQGTVSIEIDVFSFGILMLEIVSRRKNDSRYSTDHPLNLTGHAWTLRKEGRGVELIDPSMEESIPQDEVLKCIQVGPLCVQDQANSRPTRIDVVFMLSNESAQLSLPKKPAFLVSSIAEMPEEDQTQIEIFSINELTMSNLEYIMNELDAKIEREEGHLVL